LGEGVERLDSNHGAVTGLTRAIRILDGLNPVVRGLAVACVVIVFVWVVFVFVDVIGRYVFNRPIAGSLDIGEIVLVVMVFFGLAYTQLHKAHIRIDVISSRLSPRGTVIVEVATYIICIAVAAVLIWQGIVSSLRFAQINEVTGLFRIPVAPIVAVIPFSCFLFLVVLLRDLLTNIVEGLKLRFRIREWSLALILPVLVIALLGLWMCTSGLSPPVVGIIGLVVMFIFVFLGMPIALALVMVGVVFIGHLGGLEAGFNLAGAGLYWNIANYSWAVIPLFVLMGYFILVSELGADSYYAGNKWVGHLPGGLAMATVSGSAAMAAVTGTTIASTVTMGTVAVPEMRKYKYADSLSTGVVAGGATLGPMIPPSLGFIIYGILAGESIGKLFIAGIIPGILLAISFMATIYIRCRRNPALGPPAERSDWRTRLSSLKAGAPIGLLFLIIIGGIYLGIFSAAEGGGIGAIMALVIALALRRVTWSKFTFALTEAMKLLSAVIFMIGGALMFGYVLGASNLTAMLVDSVTGLQVSSSVVVAAILLVYLILGFVIDANLVMLLTIPLFAPLAQTLGIDLIWFGVLVVLITNLGGITPPYGIVLFILKGVVKDIRVTTIYRGVMPFVVSSLVVAVIIFVFPSVATWLPYSMK